MAKIVTMKCEESSEITRPEVLAAIEFAKSLKYDTATEPGDIPCWTAKITGWILWDDRSVELMQVYEKEAGYIAHLHVDPAAGLIWDLDPGIIWTGPEEFMDDDAVVESLWMSFREKYRSGPRQKLEDLVFA